MFLNALWLYVCIFHVQDIFNFYLLVKKHMVFSIRQGPLEEWTEHSKLPLNFWEDLITIITVKKTLVKNLTKLRPWPTL